MAFVVRAALIPVALVPVALAVPAAPASAAAAPVLAAGAAAGPGSPTAYGPAAAPASSSAVTFAEDGVALPEDGLALAAGEEPPGYAWPVSGPVLRRFEAPPSRFEAGHRGIDIGAPLGTPVRASSSGTVSFAGWVAGSRFVSIDHPDGVRTTYSWLSSVAVVRGTPVAQGHVIGATGHGHPDLDRPHLHFGARIGEEYIDPLILLGAAGARIHLAPLDETDT